MKRGWRADIKITLCYAHLGWNIRRMRWQNGWRDIMNTQKYLWCGEVGSVLAHQNDIYQFSAPKNLGLLAHQINKTCFGAAILIARRV